MFKRTKEEVLFGKKTLLQIQSELQAAKKESIKLKEEMALEKEYKKVIKQYKKAYEICHYFNKLRLDNLGVNRELNAYYSKRLKEVKESYHYNHLVSEKKRLELALGKQ